MDDELTNQSNQQLNGNADGRTLSAVQRARRRKPLIKRYPLIIAAIVLAVFIVGGAVTYSLNRNQAVVEGGQDFDPSSVLPAPVSQPESSTVYTAETIKAFDGKDGNKCYVAVKKVVYEIKDSSYWKNGEHTPSAGQGMCGADMTEVIGQSPHGESILGRLPQVGIFE